MSQATASDHEHDDHRRLFPDEWPDDPHFGKASVGKVGMWMFLLSDALMFAGFLLAYGILRGGTDIGVCTEAVADGLTCWRHNFEGFSANHNFAQPDYGIDFTAGLTFLLICSSVTMVIAVAKMVEKQPRKAAMWLAFTAIGGMLFLAGQYHEYWGIWHPGLTKRGLIFGESAYATTFYLVTSFHGMHVLTGVIILWTFFFKTIRGHYDDGNYDHIEIVGLFWHFVDLIWILVFTVIYLIPPMKTGV